VLSLAERHTPERTEAACAKALSAGDPSYRTIKGILAASRDRPDPAEEAGTQTPAFLRGPAAFLGDEATPDEAVVVEAESIVAAADALLEVGGEVTP
jgi:hypothetical protein